MLSLTLKQNLPFSLSPRFVELDPKKFLLNNVILPSDTYNPHRIRLWVIGHEFGPICAVWAGCEQDALDEAVDANMLDCCQISNGDEDEDTAYLGNASEPFDLTHVWMGEVEATSFTPALLAQIAQALDNDQRTLCISTTSTPSSNG